MWCVIVPEGRVEGSRWQAAKRRGHRIPGRKRSARQAQKPWNTIDVACFDRHRAGVVLMTAGNPFDVGCFDRQCRRSSVDVACFDCQHERSSFDVACFDRHPR